MTKLKLANEIVKKYMPSSRFDDRDPSELDHVQSHIEGVLKFDFRDCETPFEDMVYSPQAFLFFWGKFLEGKNTTLGIKFLKHCWHHICTIHDPCKNPTSGIVIEVTQAGVTQIEAFYRAVQTWEEEK